MIVVIVVLALALALALPLTVGLFLHHIREAKRTTDLQISRLLNRIQAPEAAVTQDLTGQAEFEPLVLAHDEESYWNEVEKVANQEDVA